MSTSNAAPEPPGSPGDPTGSADIQNRFERRFHDRWRTLRGGVRSLLRGDRHYRPSSARAPTSVKAADFREWLDGALEEHVVEPVPHRAQRRGGHWTARHVDELYRHGIEQADAVIESADADTGSLRSPKAAVGRGEHADQRRAHYVEVHQDVVDAANAAEKEATRAYRDALRSGASIRATVGAVNDRLDAIGDTRSQLVAKSKAVVIVNEASLLRYQAAGADRVAAVPETVDAADANAHAHAWGETGHDVDAFQTDAPEPTGFHYWSTAGDRRVCPECASLAGSTYRIEEIRNGDAPMPVRDTHAGCRCYYVASFD